MSNKKEKYLYSFEAEDASKVKRKFCILNPNRKMKEDGELFYASKLSQFISAGVLPKIVWDKIFKDSGGIISQIDQKEYSDLFEQFVDYRNSIDGLSVKAEKDRSVEENERLKFFEAQLVMTRKRMQEMEMAQVNAFENTAEAKARNRTIVWWAATLAAEEVNGVPQSILGAGSIEDKLDNYDSIVENDQFLSDCFSRINYLITVWYLGSAANFEEFKSLDEEYLKRISEENLYLESDSENQEVENLSVDKAEDKEKDKEKEEPSVLSS